MSYGHTQQAKGFSIREDGATVKIAVTIPREHFDFMKRKALAKGWSISEAIREYIATGIYVDQDMGEDYPAPGGSPTCKEILQVQTTSITPSSGGRSPTTK